MGGLAVCPIVIADACLLPYAVAGGVVGLVACAVLGLLPFPTLEPASVVVAALETAKSASSVGLGGGSGDDVLFLGRGGDGCRRLWC